MNNIPGLCLLFIDIYRPIDENGKPDILEYNKELKALQSPKWFDVPWLFAECYLYRYAHRTVGSMVLIVTS